MYWAQKWRGAGGGVCRDVDPGLVCCSWGSRTTEAPLAEVLGVGNMPWAEGPLRLRFFLLLQGKDSGCVLWAGGLRARAGTSLVLRL